MAVLEGEANLREVVEDLVLRERRILLSALLNLVSELAVISELHHDVQVPLFVLEDVLETDDVRVVKNFENTSFISRASALFVSHVLQVHLLNHPEFVAVASDEVSVAVRTAAQLLNLAVFLFLRGLSRLHLTFPRNTSVQS